MRQGNDMRANRLGRLDRLVRPGNSPRLTTAGYHQANHPLVDSGNALLSQQRKDFTSENTTRHKIGGEVPFIGWYAG